MSFSSNQAPRYFTILDFIASWPQTVIVSTLHLLNCCLLPNVIYSIFPGLSVSLFWYIHSLAFLKFVSKSSIVFDSLSLIGLKHFCREWSSAVALTVISVSITFLIVDEEYEWNNTGPFIDPCGPPQNIFFSRIVVVYAYFKYSVCQIVLKPLKCCASYTILFI